MKYRVKITREVRYVGAGEELTLRYVADVVVSAQSEDDAKREAECVCIRLSAIGTQEILREQKFEVMEIP